MHGVLTFSGSVYGERKEQEKRLYNQSDIQMEGAGIDGEKDRDDYIPQFCDLPISGAGGYQSIPGRGNLNYESPGVAYYDDVPVAFGFTGVQVFLGLSALRV